MDCRDPKRLRELPTTDREKLKWLAELTDPDVRFYDNRGSFVAWGRKLVFTLDGELTDIYDVRKVERAGCKPSYYKIDQGGKR